MYVSGCSHVTIFFMKLDARKIPMLLKKSKYRIIKQVTLLRLLEWIEC